MYSVIWPPGNAVQEQVAHLSLSETRNLAEGDRNLSFPEPNQNNTTVNFSLVILKFFSVGCVCLVWNDGTLMYFVLQKLEQYDMSGDWRGFALIINNYDFSNCQELKNREGTDIDESKHN